MATASAVGSPSYALRVDTAGLLVLRPMLGSVLVGRVLREAFLWRITLVTALVEAVGALRNHGVSRTASEVLVLVAVLRIEAEEGSVAESRVVPCCRFAIGTGRTGLRCPRWRPLGMPSRH